MTLSPIVIGSDRLPVSALVVDRDADTRAMYAEYLRLASCEVDEAEDGREALAKALSHPPDILITETRLSGINGYDLCGLLRHDPATRNIGIVVVTGDAYPADMQRARTMGADTVLAKPCLPEDLLGAVRRLLAASAELRQRSVAVRDKLALQVAKSEALLARSPRPRRAALSRSHQRGVTTSPAVAAPALRCPACDRALSYQHSHIGGVSVRFTEQWDYYECTAGCGSFQYRERTRKLRRL